MGRRLRPSHLTTAPGASPIGVIEIDQRLVEHAAELTLDLDLRSLDAMHLAAALVLPRDDLVIATWDRELHAAARTTGLRLTPETLP